MASELKVDTISEKTSGGGVTIDGVLLKDGGITGDIQLSGTTPSLTIGDAGAEDAKLVFDGNAQDFYIALDDSADDLIIGLGSAVGTTPMLSFTEAKAAAFTGAVTMASTLGVTGVVTGAGFTAGSAVLAEAELELLDGLTAGTAIASKVVTTDGNIDTSGQRNLTISGELDAATGDFSGAVDIAGATTVAALTASGVGQIATLGIGAAKDLGTGIHIKTSDNGGGSVDAASDELVIESNGNTGMTIGSGSSSTGTIAFGDQANNNVGKIEYDHNTEYLRFIAGAGEVLRLKADSVVVNENSDDVDFRVESNANAHSIFLDGGNNRLIFMKATNAIGTAGTTIENDGAVIIARAGNAPLNINRAGDGGVIVNLSQAGTVRGTISESGGTVSYNAFCGSHWSRLTDNSKPTIFRGTVMESISTLLTWYQVEFSVPTLDENGANVIDENGDNVVSVERESITLPEGKSVGDTITHTWPSDGKDYSAKIIQEENERLPMCKISNTADSKSVYGVFMDWDNDDDTVNDMYVAGIGAFVVRVHKDETVAIGNWLVSKGDGTAKVLAGNTAITADVQSSIIGKVTSTTKTHTHADDSYCVPCTLHCG